MLAAATAAAAAAEFLIVFQRFFFVSYFFSFFLLRTVFVVWSEHCVGQLRVLCCEILSMLAIVSPLDKRADCAPI